MSNPNHHPFAPGAITAHRSAQRAELLRWIHHSLHIAATAAGLALLAGIVYGALQ